MSTKVIIVSTPNGSTIGNLIASMGYDVEFCDATDSIKGMEVETMFIDEYVPVKPIVFGKLKNSLNHLPYEDRKKFWNRR